jgi:tetratricopeptide (TPR) repeat protein
MATHLADRTEERFSLRCWGDFVLCDAEGVERRPRGRKARALIAYLALHPDRRISRERLTTLLWGDRADEQARSSLRQSLFELRAFGNGAGLLSIERDGVTLHSHALGTDIQSIRAAADASDYVRLIEGLPDPDDTLFADLDGLGDSFDEWLRIERTTRRDELIQLIADASAQAVAEGAVREARTLHARLLAFAPEAWQPGPAPAAILPDPLPVRSAATPSVTRRTWIAGATLTLATAGAGLWLAGRPTGSSEEIRGLVETAEAIIYKRKFATMPAAADLLRRAVALDPGHARAWAGLAAITAMTERTPEGMAEAERLARKAISLDPQLGRAHGVLGMALGFQPDEARAAIRRAARLSPRDPEILYWLSHVHGAEGNFPARLDALRRAAAIDPMWHRASGTAALAALELGREAEARAYAERLARSDPRASYLCAYAVDWARGDYSEVVRSTLAARPHLQQTDAADWKLGLALLILGHVDPAELLLRLPPELWGVATGQPLDPAGFIRLNREAELDSQADSFIEAATRQLISAGRHREVADLYQTRQGRAGSFAATGSDPARLAAGGVDIALALRRAGKVAESERLLARIEEALRRCHGFGAVPNWLHAGAAQLWAAKGQTGAALDALERAVGRGWRYAPFAPLPDLAEVPAFASLGQHPRFQAVRAQLREDLRREQAELGPVPI